MMKCGNSARILIRRMKSSIRERKGKCCISQKEIMNMFGRKKRKPLRQLITHKEPKSRITEQYRNIRTNIEFTSVDNHVRSIIVTSADQVMGKQQQSQT